MITNYYTLRHLTQDLDRTLSGGTIEEIYCQNKDELLISSSGSRPSSTLVISCEPSRNSLYLRSPVRRAKINSIDFFRSLRGKIVRSIHIHPSDREITIETEERARLIIQMFGSKANVLMVNEEGIIADSFLRSKDVTGSKFTEQPRSATPIALTVAELQRKVQAIGFVLATAAIKKSLPAFDSVLIREVFFRAKILEDRMAAELSGVEIQALASTVSIMTGALTSAASPRIYYDGDIPRAFSILPLFHLAQLRMEEFDSLHDAIRVYIGSAQKQSTFFREKESLLHFLESNTERARRTLSKMATETASFERAASYETMGKLLMASLPQLSKGMKRYETENLFSPSRERITIPLEQNLTPAKNAERYFEKAKKARSAVQEKLALRKEIEERWEQLRELREQVEPLRAFDLFQEFVSTRREQCARLGYKIDARKGKETAPEVPFRVFTVTGGFEVWVGKSSENNDLLTMKYAKPNDLWFHARGSSGSHVVLRTGTGKGEVGKKAQEQAAAIAAYYSKMKTSKIVPVAMTQRKYVRKPKGAPAGTVTIEREKLLFVEPALPDNNQR